MMLLILVIFAASFGLLWKFQVVQPVLNQMVVYV